MAVAADDHPRPLSDGDRQEAPRAHRTDRRRGERRLTPFERALRGRIAVEGPIGIDAYMEACNTYYYATRDPLGGAGDFTTAPEISQMFGELAGACLADCWNRAGAPADAIYAELGPGRGTLAADALRVLRAAGFAGEAHFVETSPVLRARQAEAVPGVAWHETIAVLPPRPLLLVANEFFDALPVCQLVDGIERRVTATGGGLAFDRDGDIVEVSPARAAAAAQLAERIAAAGGLALVIDYGHAQSAPGDTLQAVRRHGHVPVLANPGEQDLTAHVDFEALAGAAARPDVAIAGPIVQGAWLDRLGIRARTALLAQRHPDRAIELAGARHRLTAAEQMGDLFKVLAIHSTRWPAPAGFEP